MRLGWLPPVAGLALLLVANQAWWQVEAGQTLLFTGSDLTGGLAQALGLVAVAASLLLLAVRGAGRRVVAALQVLVFAGAAWCAVAAQAPTMTEILARQPVAASDAVATADTGLRWFYLAAAVLGAAASVLAMVRKPGRRGVRPAPTADAPLADSLTNWKAMDDGVDPALDPPRPDHVKEQP